MDPMEAYRSKPPKNYDNFLPAFLGIIVIISLMAGYTMLKHYFNLPSGKSPNFKMLVLFAAVTAFLRTPFCYGIYKWKKWGVFGLALTMAAEATVTVFIVGSGAEVFGTIFRSIVSLAILYKIIGDKWEKFT